MAGVGFSWEEECISQGRKGGRGFLGNGGNLRLRVLGVVLIYGLPCDDVS